MIRLVLAVFLALKLSLAPALAEGPVQFWDLKPEALRVLVGSPQVLVTRTEGGVDAYCRCPVILKPHEIPEAMKKAIVAIEDKRYFDHGGVDLITLLSVLRGGLNRGGSTIPMQLLKNLVLHDLQQRDFMSRLERKGAEFWHAGSFDGAVGKEELLAAYLNQIEFGGREIVGLYRASRHYFRKEPRDLNLYEAAMLAGMVQAPARLNPLKEATRERAHERAKLVLRVMEEQGKIKPAERKLAEQRGLTPGILPEFKLQTQAFTEWVVQNAGEKVAVGETLRFFVTLDTRLQWAAERHLDDLVTEGTVPPEYEAAAVMMSADGAVRAMVGGTDWGRRQFNNAVKGQVQPGSTAKLPLIVAACEAGRKPESRVVDLPVTENWPANGTVGYRGETTLREAMALSRNAAAVRLAGEIGVRRVAETSRRLGIEPGADPNPAFVLGTFSTSPLAMTAAYAAVANGGLRAAPRGILAVVDGRGQVRANHLEPGRGERIIPQRCIDPTRSILQEVVRAGTGRGAALRSAKAFGKTGTTSGNADAWFIGWSEGGAEKRVMGVWMGRRRDEGGGAAIAGSGPPADLFRRVQNAAIDLDARRTPSLPVREPAVAGKPSPKGGVTVVEKDEPGTTGSSPARRTSQVPVPPTRPRGAGNS